MSHVEGVLFRPTGNSLLVGLVELQPGSYSKYIDALKPVLESSRKPWAKRFQKQQSGAIRNLDPEHILRTCGFLGLGAWDLITLTIMNEKGLGTHLSYIGHTRGQSYFYGNDFSLVLDPGSVGKSKRDCLLKLAKMAKTAGITDLVKLDNNSSVKGFKLKSRESLKDGSNYQACWRPLSLSHINSGRDLEDIWGSDKRIPDKIVDRSNELLGLFQLKLNQVLLSKKFAWTMQIAYLTILALNELVRSESKMFEKDHLPKVVRPFFSDGYFDLLVLMRCSWLSPMDYMMQKLKFMTIETSLKLLDDCGIGLLVQRPSDQFILKEPLFELTHSIIGFSNRLRHTSFSEMKDQLKDLKTQDVLMQHQSQKVRKKILKVYKSYRKIFKPFNHPTKWKGSENKDLYAIASSTLASVNAGMMSRTLEELDRLVKMLRIDDKFPATFKLGQGLLYGPHDLELFARDDLIFFGDMVADHQFLKHMMIRFLITSNRQDRLRERELSPLLSLFTQVGAQRFELEKVLVDSPLESLDRLPCPSKSILSVTNIRGIIEQIEQQLPSQNDTNKYWLELFKERKSYWNLVLEGEDLITEGALQASFYAFLRRFFGLAVSAETLESLFTAFCAVESGLADPLRYILFLDVGKYLNQVFTALLTLHDPHAIEFPNFWDVGLDLNRTPEGKECDFIFFDPDKIKLVEKKGERGGCISVEAYLLRVVDLIHEVCSQRTNGAYPYHDRSYGRISDLRNFHTKKLVSVSWMVNNIIEAMSEALRIEVPRYLGVLKSKEVKQQLEMMEKPATHYLARFSNSPESILSFTDRSVSLNARHLSTLDSMVLLVHEIGHILGHIVGETHKYNSASDYIIDEVSADLFVHKLCFSHFRNQEDGPEAFVLSWIFQLINLPKPRREDEFRNKTLVRIGITYQILKLEQRLLEVKSIDDEVLLAYLNEEWKTFYRDKIPNFLERLAQSIEPQAKTFKDFGDHGFQEQQPNLVDSYWMTYFQSGKDPNPSLQEKCKNKMAKYLALRNKKATYAYMAWLASPTQEHASPYLNPQWSEEKWEVIDDGILESLHQFENEQELFAASLQMVGRINLSFSNREETRPVFSNGHPGFENNHHQQSLSRQRQLVAMLLLQGGAVCIRNYLESLEV